MSWSKGAGPTTAADVDEALAAIEYPEGAAPEVTEQIDAAKDAAKGLIESGALGGEDKAFSITLSGHANASHNPHEGYANDAISISVGQVAAPVEEEAEETEPPAEEAEEAPADPDAGETPPADGDGAPPEGEEPPAAA